MSDQTEADLFEAVKYAELVRMDQMQRAAVFEAGTTGHVAWERGWKDASEFFGVRMRMTYTAAHSRGLADAGDRTKMRDAYERGMYDGRQITPRLQPLPVTPWRDRLNVALVTALAMGVLSLLWR